MLVSDVLRIKGPEVLKIRATDPVDAAVHRLVERRIGALVVEDQWMRLVGLFSERDFVKAIARHGPAVLHWEVQKLMTSPIVSCRSSDRIDVALTLMTVKLTRHLPVIDDRELVGIVSIGDLVKHRLDEMAQEANVLLEISRMRA